MMSASEGGGVHGKADKSTGDVRHIYVLSLRRCLFSLEIRSLDITGGGGRNRIVRHNRCYLDTNEIARRARISNIASPGAGIVVNVSSHAEGT